MNNIVRFPAKGNRERVQAELEHLTVERITVFKAIEDLKRRLLGVNHAIAAKYDELRRLAERARR